MSYIYLLSVANTFVKDWFSVLYEQIFESFVKKKKRKAQ